jgi:hypothetical protein
MAKFLGKQNTEVPHTTYHNRPKLVRMRKNSITAVEGVARPCANPSFSLDPEALSLSSLFASRARAGFRELFRAV